jgi:hypothetical protein
VKGEKYLIKKNDAITSIKVDLIFIVIFCLLFLWNIIANRLRFSLIYSDFIDFVSNENSYKLFYETRGNAKTLYCNYADDGLHWIVISNKNGNTSWCFNNVIHQGGELVPESYFDLISCKFLTLF